VITVRDAVYVRTQFYPGEPLADYGFGF
jgi:hypothetical protein